MAVRQKSARITVDLGDRELYRQLRHAAVEEDRTVRDIVAEALRYWLDHREEIEDELADELADRVTAESTGEYITHEQVKERMSR